MIHKVLVTGGAGYIGSHTCKALSQAGYTPVVLDNLSYGHRWAVQWGPFIQGDLLNQALIESILLKEKIQSVMHFAGSAYVGESVEQPHLYYLNNVQGSLCLLNAMRQQGVRQIVFSSSCATYGVPLEVPISEQHSQNPINPYGFTKLIVEKMLIDFQKAYGFRSMILRYFNAAGADHEGLLWEAHDPETHLIPRAFQVITSKIPYLSVFGQDYPTPDGTCIRDYIHVEDLAHAHVLALQALEKGQPSRAYNLGNGRGYSVKEVLDTIEAVTQQKVATVVEDRREGDPPVLIANADLAIQELNWTIRYQCLHDIVKTAWSAFKNHSF